MEHQCTAGTYRYGTELHDGLMAKQGIELELLQNCVYIA